MSIRKKYKHSKSLTSASPPEGAVQGSMHVLPDTETCWTKNTLIAATGGEWVIPPPYGWEANGVAITSGRVRQGVLVCYGKDFFTASALRNLLKVASGIICENAEKLAHLGLPVLEVPSINKALCDLASYARSQYSGRVIALTGSVGKTGTTYLLGQILSLFGAVEHTRASGNSPRANACLLASISKDIPFWVTEIALNDPALISSFAKPHIAMVLAVSAAHLVYWKDTKQVALRKSAIFSGMESGGYAILNRDMQEYETVEAQALNKQLHIISYGRHEQAAFRLLEYTTGNAVFSMYGKQHSFPCLLPPHMQMNMLAILACVHALGYKVEQCFKALENPELLPGRGKRHQLILHDKKITVIDDSYNANPESMKAALQGLCFAAPNASARVAVLGDIAELGETELDKHLELVSSIKDCQPDRLLLCGPLMQHVWEKVKNTLQGKWFANVADLQSEIHLWLKDGDVVVFKSSGHRFSDIVTHLLHQHCPSLGCEPKTASASAIIAIGGNVNIGRRQHLTSRRSGYAYALGSIEALRKADLSIASLNCVAANHGQIKVEKDTTISTYLKARPEQLEILREAGLGLVATANSHSDDYGADALMEQLHHLDTMGIAHAGSGCNKYEACEPAYRKVKNFTVAVFSVDTTVKTFAATAGAAGSSYLPLYNPDLWYKEYAPRIAQARKKAHIVLFMLHRHTTETNATSQTGRAIAYALVDAGADAVFCSSPQTYPAIEVYKEHPVVYGMGDLLGDVAQNRQNDCGLFTLGLSAHGIKEVHFLPLISGGGRTVPATGADALRIIEAFAERSNNLKTEVCKHLDYASITLQPHSRNMLPLRVGKSAAQVIKPAPKPAARPSSEWVLREVDLPAHLRIEPVQIGPLTLRGCWVPSTARQMDSRRIIWVESYWSIQEKVDKDFLLYITAGAIEGNNAPRFGDGMRHDPCDWVWPTSRWEPGTIYKDIVGLLPPPLAALQSQNALHSQNMRLRFRVMEENTVLGSYTLPIVLSLKLKN